MTEHEISILMVDDEPDFLTIVAKRLEKRNIRVQLAHSGEEGLTLLAEAPCQVVVLDVKMPGMDGLQALAQIKQLYPAIGVIMLSGHADVDAAIKGMELGAHDYLLKPMDIDELMYKIRDAAKSHSSSMQEREKMEDTGMQ